MKVEFVKEHGVYRPGQVVDHPHDGVADTLVRRGIARLPRIVVPSSMPEIVPPVVEVPPVPVVVKPTGGRRNR
jgi:hypothetical protein